MSGRAGPVLHAGPVAEAVVAAIRALNADVSVLNRGAYLRVSAAGRCRVTREAIEREIGATFELPRDLEAVMSSFAGRLTVDEGEAVWTAPGQKR